MHFKYIFTKSYTVNAISVTFFLNFPFLFVKLSLNCSLCSQLNIIHHKMWVYPAHIPVRKMVMFSLETFFRESIAYIQCNLNHFSFSERIILHYEQYLKILFMEQRSIVPFKQAVQRNSLVVS